MNTPRKPGVEFEPEIPAKTPYQLPATALYKFLVFTDPESFKTAVGHYPRWNPSHAVQYWFRTPLDGEDAGDTFEYFTHFKDAAGNIAKHRRVVNVADAATENIPPIPLNTNPVPVPMRADLVEGESYKSEQYGPGQWAEHFSVVKGVVDVPPAGDATFQATVLSDLRAIKVAVHA